MDSQKLIDEYRTAKAEGRPLPFLTDSDLLKKHHKFLRDSTDSQDAEAQEAIEIYKRLYKEYCLADLSDYKKGNVGMRWRTEEEVLNGKGVELCGDVHCTRRNKLTVLEVNFGYIEDGERKNALVKVTLCRKCKHKLMKARSLKRQQEVTTGA